VTVALAMPRADGEEPVAARTDLYVPVVRSPRHRSKQPCPSHPSFRGARKGEPGIHHPDVRRDSGLAPSSRRGMTRSRWACPETDPCHRRHAAPSPQRTCARACPVVRPS
jgi:hypothetical protein